MNCHRCSESIEVGEAMTQIPTPGGYHWWFFHPGCFSDWNEEQERALTRINNIRHLAGYVH